MKGLISCSVACRFYDIPTGKCKLKCEEKADPNADFYDDCPLPDVREIKHGRNITEMNPVDEFVCSECGFMLCDFTEIRIDEDTHYNSYHECYIKYCPNCGAKMDGGENDGN